MRKQILLDIDSDLYDGVCGLEGVENVSRYLEKLIRLHLPHPDLDQGYQEMAADVEKRARSTRVGGRGN